MGVRGLHGFVGSSCPHVCTEVNFRELAEQHRSTYPGHTPTIVVDAMCCLRYWYTPESWVCGGQWKEYFSVLEDFVRTFTAAGIKLVFFFDGMVEQDKRDEWVRRRLKNGREIARIFRYVRAHGEQPGRNMFFIPSGLAIFTRFALKTLGQDTMCSLQEADYEVASYGLRNNCLGILGEDTDYLIYDTCPYFSISELCLDSLTTIMLCRQKLCASLDLGLPDLPLLACLLGNDIVPEGTFETFRYKCLSSYTSVRENCDKKGSVVFAVADHISKVLRLHQGEKKLEEMLPLGPNKALFYKAMASYLLPGQKSPWISHTPKAATTSDKQEVPMSSDSESKPEVPVNLEPEIKQQVTMVSDAEILEVARARHVQAESYLVYSIMTSGEVECSNTLEDALDQALPSQALVYRPVRQRVYSLLLADGQGGAGSCPPVREWFVYAGNPLRHPDLVRPLQMSIPGGTPSLKQLWLSQEPGTQARRVDVLLACLDLSSCSSREELQALESPFRMLCCLLIYLFVQLDHVDPRAVQLGSLLVRGLTTLVLVNSACGFPWRTSELMPWNVFDGKLFHEKYLQSEKGYSVEALVEQNRSRLATFYQLKSIVCKACLEEGRRIASQQLWRRHHTGRWGRQGPSSHRTSSGHSRSSQGQHWRDQGPGGRHHEPDPWRRHAPSSRWSN
ncbi:constitutive coactivator of peroxisome proliferator-activated receptor gamma isoform 2-T2 [Glossophaga mutica]